MRCEAEVFRGNTGVVGVGAYSQCTRRARTRVNGEWYCWQHHPDNVKEREKRSSELAEIKWRNKMRRKGIVL